MRVIFVVGMLASTITTASAWTIERTKDPMTDRTNIWASVTDKGATLLVGCLNGQVEARLTWPDRIGYGSQLGLSYRVDKGEVVPRFAMLTQDGRTLYPWAGVDWLRPAKRLRVQIDRTVFDFDLVKGAPEIPAIRCH
jgi:hypothetical protein